LFAAALLLFAATVTVAADTDTVTDSVTDAGTAPVETAVDTLQARYRQAEAERRQLADENARLRERLETARRDSDLAARIAAQTVAIEVLAQRLERARTEPAAAAGAAGADAAASVPEISVARLRAELAETRRRLDLLIGQFAEAHLLRLRAMDQSAAARGQIAELKARLHQQQLIVQEAQRRAEKAEKLYAALDEAQARATTENERLGLELATTRERLAEALQQVVALDTRLAAAEARVTQLQGEAKTLLGQGPRVRFETGADGEADAGSQPAAADAAPVTGDAAAVAPEPARPRTGGAVTPAVYMVRSDDTLSRISAKVYGDASVWRRIYDANRDVLATPDELAPGMTLVIP
jgi:nucleoid-associated protein YgaU